MANEGTSATLEQPLPSEYHPEKVSSDIRTGLTKYCDDVPEPQTNHLEGKKLYQIKYAYALLDDMLVGLRDIGDEALDTHTKLVESDPDKALKYIKAAEGAVHIARVVRNFYNGSLRYTPAVGTMHRIRQMHPGDTLQAYQVVNPEAEPNQDPTIVTLDGMQYRIEAHVRTRRYDGYFPVKSFQSGGRYREQKAILKKDDPRIDILKRRPDNSKIHDPEEFIFAEGIRKNVHYEHIKKDPRLQLFIQPIVTGNPQGRLVIRIDADPKREPVIFFDTEIPHVDELSFPQSLQSEVFMHSQGGKRKGYHFRSGTDVEGHSRIEKIRFEEMLDVYQAMLRQRTSLKPSQQRSESVA